MVALTFGNLTPTNNTGGWSLGTQSTGNEPKPAAFSLGTPFIQQRAKSPTDFQYPKVTAQKTTSKPALTFGLPSFKTGFSRVNDTPLSYGSSVKPNNSGSFLNTLSMGVSGGSTPTDRGWSLGSLVPSVLKPAPTTAPIYNMPASIAPNMKPVTTAGGSDAGAMAGALAADIFSSMFTKVSAQSAPTPTGGAGATFGGGSASSGGLLDSIGPTEIILGAVALGVVFMLVSGGSKTRSAPRRRKA